MATEAIFETEENLSKMTPLGVLGSKGSLTSKSA
jgi:hypothetical protein